MKKLLAGLFVFTFVVLGVSSIVQADVIWEPENLFYKMHADDCEYHNRNYIANGPEGEVIVYKSPEVKLKIETIENGMSVNIYYLYEAKNGVLWGLYENWKSLESKYRAKKRNFHLSIQIKILIFGLTQEVKTVLLF